MTSVYSWSCPGSAIGPGGDVAPVLRAPVPPNPFRLAAVNPAGNATGYPALACLTPVSHARCKTSRHHILKPLRQPFTAIGSCRNQGNGQGHD